VSFLFQQETDLIHPAMLESRREKVPNQERKSTPNLRSLFSGYGGYRSWPRTIAKSRAGTKHTKAESKQLVSVSDDGANATIEIFLWKN
jgi:hypothetical protein